jgi:hypothetical protein
MNFLILYSSRVVFLLWQGSYQNFIKLALSLVKTVVMPDTVVIYLANQNAVSLVFPLTQNNLLLK